MTKHYVFSDDNFDTLCKIRNRMAELALEHKADAKAYYEEMQTIYHTDETSEVKFWKMDNREEKYLDDTRVNLIKRENQEWELHKAMAKAFTIYDLDTDGYSECANGECQALYHPDEYPDNFNPDLCPDCQVGEPDEDYDPDRVTIDEQCDAARRMK